MNTLKEHEHLTWCLHPVPSSSGRFTSEHHPTSPWMAVSFPPRLCSAAARCRISVADKFPRISAKSSPRRAEGGGRSKRSRPPSPRPTPHLLVHPRRLEALDVSACPSFFSLTFSFARRTDCVHLLAHPSQSLVWQFTAFCGNLHGDVIDSIVHPLSSSHTHLPIPSHPPSCTKKKTYTKKHIDHCFGSMHLSF